MTLFYLIRHGETDYSRNDTMIFKGSGVNFSPLKKEGINQIEQTSLDSRLKDCSLIISSAYTRTMQSAAIISKNLQIDLVVEPTLFEWEENKLFNGEKVNHKKSMDEYFENNGVYPKDDLKMWEDNILMSNRLLEVMERYLDYDKVIIVCHGMLIHSLFPDDWLECGEMTEYNYDYTPAERFAIYDVNGNKTGRTMTDGYNNEPHEYSMFVHIVIANHKGEFLLQKRSVKKKYFPGVWDTTGGCVKHDEETIDAALRETKEETGLTFNKNQIKFVKRLFHNNFVDIFYAQKEFAIDDCTMDESEVDELKLYEPEDMYNVFYKEKNPPCHKEYLEVLRKIIDHL